MRTLPAVCVLLALPLVACGDGDGNGTLIGAPCQRSVDCGPVAACLTEGPDGMCALPCEVSGAPQECPRGTYCDSQNVEIDGEPSAEATLCLPACVDKSDCREGYECNGVSGGPGKVCEPKK